MGILQFLKNKKQLSEIASLRIQKSLRQQQKNWNKFDRNSQITWYYSFRACSSCVSLLPSFIGSLLIQIICTWFMGKTICLLYTKGTLSMVTLTTLPLYFEGNSSIQHINDTWAMLIDNNTIPYLVYIWIHFFYY